MKRKVIATVIGAAGLVGLATSSFGQGQIIFDNYGASPYYSVKYSPASVTALGLGSSSAGANVDVELGWAAGFGQTTGFTLVPGSITAINPALGQPDGGVGPSVGGWFQGGTQLIGTTGNVTYEILAWVASGNGAGDGTYTGAKYHGSLLFNDQAGSTALPASNFTGMTGDVIINPVPEPTTLALAGLGGLASLIAFRRKQA